jgi:hypothetical protein
MKQGVIAQDEASVTMKQVYVNALVDFMAADANIIDS